MVTKFSEIENVNKIIYDMSLSQNVVWQITDLTDFQRILQPFIFLAKEAGIPVVYICFSDKSVMEGIKNDVEVITIPLNHRFETFTVEVYNTIRKKPDQVFYIFDSLSELQTAWATDLMMENFFRVLTPVISEKHARAFFPLIRGRHSFSTNEIIREYTEIFLDLYSDFKNLYMRVQKIKGCDAGPAFMPHMYDFSSNLFKPILDGVMLSHFQRALNLSSRAIRDQHMDSWDRFFKNTQKKFENGSDITEECSRMCNIMMSRDKKIRSLITIHFQPEDYFFVKEHMIGTGLIGGKACGMLIARKIIENKDLDLYNILEPHDSFYIGSDIFYSYIVENGLWDIRVRQRTKEGYFALADDFSEKLYAGRFSEKTEEEFVRLLEYYGQSPIIVRSSSILEDGFGNAFAGKYESVFCSCFGSLKERLKEFEDAIRTVYASTMSRSALDYRVRRGLDNRDEQMAILVQRVSGSHYGEYFMPCAAGVGYSYGTYRFLDSIDPEAGMLRLVMGLGTSAVDRTEGSHPRLVSLDKPASISFKSVAEHHKYSQQNIELIHKTSGKLEKIPCSKVLDCLPDYLKKILFDHDRDAERQFRERGIYRDIYFVSCGGLVKNERLMKDIQEILHLIQEEYGQPVDIEYTINLSEDGEYIFNLLQCRPLHVFHDKHHYVIPEELKDEDVFIDCNHSSMGVSKELKVDGIVYIDPIAYYNMPYNEKRKIERVLGAVNWSYRGRNKNIILLTPGRIGTSSPELGVPATFSDISEFSAIMEIAESKAGYNPELSYGSHIFQDLVENEILYLAIFEDERTSSFRPEKLQKYPNMLKSVVDVPCDIENIMGLYLMEDTNCVLYHDLSRERLVCTISEKDLL